LLIREALAQGSADLKYAGIETPALDAALLLAHVLKTTRTALIASGKEKIKEADCAAFCGLIERRCGGECAAYLTGKKEFRGLEFAVNKSVLVPRPDTETLVETALNKLEIWNEELGIDCLRVLDLCTGSGAVAVSLKHERPELDVYASDISEEALETAKANAAHLLPDKKIHFFLGNLYDALPCSLLPASCSMIISNPPYIPSSEIDTLSAEVRNEPRIALDGGASGLEIIKRIIEDAPDYLRQNGLLLLEADPRQMHGISIMLDKRGFKDILIYKDLSGSDRVIGGSYEK